MFCIYGKHRINPNYFLSLRSFESTCLIAEREFLTVSKAASFGKPLSNVHICYEISDKTGKRFSAEAADE